MHTVSYSTQGESVFSKLRQPPLRGHIAFVGPIWRLVTSGKDAFLEIVEGIERFASVSICIHAAYALGPHRLA